MATTRGCKGVVKIKAVGATSATNAVAELADWSYDESAEQIDVSAMGTCTKKYDAGAQSTTGQIRCHWDGTDTTGQNLLVVGSAVIIEVYPGGTATGTKYYKTGASGATILSVNRAGNGVDGTVGATFGYAVNGAMTATTA